MNQEPQTTTSLREFLTVLFKHKQKIVVMFLATVVMVTVGSFLLSPTYEAQSTLMVKFGREYIYRPEVGPEGSTISFHSFNQEEAINSEIQILTSRDLIEQVITTLGLEKMYPDLIKNPPQKISPMEAAVFHFEKTFSAEGIRKSNVIEVSFQHKDPHIAAMAVNRLVELFKEKHLHIFSDPKSSFLENQLTAYRQRLHETESKLEAFKQKNQVFNLDEQRSLLLKQRMELDTTFKMAQNRINELRKKHTLLKNRLLTIANYTETDQTRIIVDAKAKLLALQLKEQELLEKYKESNRLILNVRKEIRLVKDFLKEQEEDITGKVKTGNVVYQEVEKELIKAEAELISQEAKFASIKQQLTQVDKEIQVLDLREKELKNLQREVAANEKSYQTYFAKLEEARISDEMNLKKMANISLIQPASVPSKPIKPRKGLNIVLGILLGAFGSLGLAFFSEYTGQGISTPESAERHLGLPVLTSVSYKK